MSAHEKHQYFYEKYLRNEMPDNERRIFEEKLSVDESFKRSFFHYKNNRKQYLAELLDDTDSSKDKRWSLNSWLYLLISITGLILSINYYLFTDQHKDFEKTGQLHSWNIFNRIPFLSHRNEPPKPTQVFKADKYQIDTTATEELTDSSAITYEEIKSDGMKLNEDADIANDVLEIDSFVTTYEKSYFEFRLKSIKNETDSIIDDSIMQNLAAKSVARNLPQSKPVLIYVEFWRSPVNFRGYKFNGKKLVLYGVYFPYEIYLLRDNDEFILRTAQNEFALVKDNSFHKF